VRQDSLLEAARGEAMLRAWRGLDRFKGRTWIEGEGTHVPFSLDGDRIEEATAFVVRPADSEDGYARCPTAPPILAAWRPSFGASGCPTTLIELAGDEFSPLPESLFA
jgi:hypothetical protein